MASTGTLIGLWRLRGVTSVCDEHFNPKHMVSIENEIVRRIVDAPSADLCLSVSLVSNRLSAHMMLVDSPIRAFLSLPQCRRFLEKYLHFDNDEIGKLAYYDDLIEGILAALNTPISQETLCRHLLVVNKIGCVIWDGVFGGIPLNDKEQKLLHRAIHQLSSANSMGITCDEALAHYKRCSKQVFPRHEEMSGIRIKRNKPIVATSRFGIFPAAGYGMYDEGKIPHVRGADIWRIDYRLSEHNAFLKNAQSKNLPLIAGASGTSARWVLLALLLLSPVEERKSIKNYLAGVAAFVSFCGHHSWHEVCVILKKAGIQYVEGQYHTVIPEEILSKSEIDEIISGVREEQLQSVKYPHESPF